MHQPWTNMNTQHLLDNYNWFIFSLNAYNYIKLLCGKQWRRTTDEDSNQLSKHLVKKSNFWLVTSKRATSIPVAAAEVPFQDRIPNILPTRSRNTAETKCTRSTSKCKWFITDALLDICLILCACKHITFQHGRTQGSLICKLIPNREERKKMSWCIWAVLISDTWHC